MTGSPQRALTDDPEQAPTVIESIVPQKVLRLPLAKIVDREILGGGGAAMR